MKYLRKLKLEPVSGEYKNPIKGQVREPKQLYEIFKDIKDKAQELLIAVFLDEHLRVKSYDILSVGTRSSTELAPPEIFGRAFVLMSREFILIHNHPKRDPKPSPGDREAIELLQKQSAVMDLGFLDFIIVGDGRYWSMFEEAEGGEYAVGPVV